MNTRSRELFWSRGTRGRRGARMYLLSRWNSCIMFDLCAAATFVGPETAKTNAVRRIGTPATNIDPFRSHGTNRRCFAIPG